MTTEQFAALEAEFKEMMEESVNEEIIIDFFRERLVNQAEAERREFAARAMLGCMSSAVTVDSARVAKKAIAQADELIGNYIRVRPNEEWLGSQIYYSKKRN